MKENGEIKMIYETIYKKLEKLGITELVKYKKLKSEGYMDLSIDILSDNEEEKHIAMAHNFIQNGDVMADPDMEIKICKKTKMAEALTYQLSSLGIFQRVYPEPGKVYPKLKIQLNSFLDQWLTNLISQGFNSTIEHETLITKEDKK